MDDLITLKQNLALWLQDNDHKLYPRDLQLEKRLMLGFYAGLPVK